MTRSVRDCLVQDYEPLVTCLELPDPDDRHVLAAAIKSRAQVIVTNNLKDFPQKSLQRWDIETKVPDSFIPTRPHRPTTVTPPTTGSFITQRP